MFVHSPSGVEFKNRKEAIIVMGHKRYERALSLKEFEFKQQNAEEDTEEGNNGTARN